MARSPPPAAINVPMAALTASTTASKHSSDLPLRSYPSPPESIADPGPGRRATSSLPAPPPDTPSSIVAEYGDGTRDKVPSAAVIAEGVVKAYSRSRSRSGASSQGHGRVRGASRSSTPTPRRSPSEDRSRSLQRKEPQRREPSPATQALNDKVQRFLNSMSPSNDAEELVKENRSLHQRIAALQRTERDLLNDNQDLARRLSAAQKRHDAQRQKWKEALLNREKVFEARIKDLESRLARQEEELLRVALDRSQETALSDAAIAAWLASRASSWRQWVDDFAHRDPNRIHSGLHPLQLRELCDGVKHFVRLTDSGELPEDLLTPAGSDGLRAAKLLLHGMLANFIMSETLASPFWVFDVVSPDALDLESPSMPRLNSLSPVGFRMDLAMWNSSVSLPLRSGNDHANSWRSSIMKTFCEGGMSADLDNTFLTEDARLLAEARLRFAGRLKDSFLRGPARFLLQDQDAAGIEKLERRLVQEMDAALRFSCQLWCRRDPPWVKGLRELGITTFDASRHDIELCQAQAPLYAQLSPRASDERDAPPSSYDGRPVIMVVQPSFGVCTSTANRKSPNDDATVWAKASVLVAAPRPVKEPASVPDAAAAQDATSPDSASIRAFVGTPTSAVAPPVPPKDPKEQAVTLLPSVAFGASPRSAPRQSPSSSMPHVEPLRVS
ncbi:cc73338e-9ff9-4dd3-ba1b-cdf649df99cd [Thermothielavioides terrestris]|nr:cc73338e-9ff9-4dd3-ba1b-cdf649df99cd [Thermothielavioides terrestris]